MPRTKSEYPVLLRKLSKAEGGGYFAEFPDLPGCMADGATAAEALMESQAALRSYLASVKKYGDKLPAPSESLWRQRAPRSLHRRCRLRPSVRGCHSIRLSSACCLRDWAEREASPPCRKGWSQSVTAIPFVPCYSYSSDNS